MPPLGPKPRLLVDGHNVAYTAVYAIREIPPPEQVASLFLHKLGVLVTGTRTVHCDVVWDTGSDPYRTAVMSEYKQHRREIQQEQAARMAAAYAGIDEVKELLRHFGVWQWQGEGKAEADDIIAQLAKGDNAAYTSVIIASTDGDLHQLLTPSTPTMTTEFPVMQVKPTAVRGPEDVGMALMDGAKKAEESGLWPYQVLYYKALRGDPSDGIDGVKGIGPVTATAMLKDYGTLYEVLDHLDEAVGKYPKAKNLASDEGLKAVSQALQVIMFRAPACRVLQTPPLALGNQDVLHLLAAARGMLDKLLGMVPPDTLSGIIRLFTDYANRMLKNWKGQK